MGVSISTIRFRGSEANLSQVLANLFNTINDSLIAAGMLRVSNEELPGQAGRMVVGAAGAGETTIIRGAAAGLTYCGSYAYKHPNMQMYLRLDLVDWGYTATSRSSVIRFLVFDQIVPGGTIGANSFTVDPMSARPNNTAVPISVDTTVVASLFVSCGADHFWMYSPPTVVMSSSSSYAAYPGAISSLAIGLFKSGDASLLVAPAPVVWSGATMFGASSSTGVIPASRYWATGGGVWAAAQNGSAGHLIDPSVSASEIGTRVVRASKYIDGIRRQFDFGFVNGGVPADGDILTVDLDGGGARSYRACLGFGPSGPTQSNTPLSQTSAIILPWAA